MGWLLIVVLAAFAPSLLLWWRVEQLRGEVQALREAVARGGVAVSEPIAPIAAAAAVPAPVVRRRPTLPLARSAAESGPEVADAARPARDRRALEALVGARLPVWVGGAALVLGGVFLVRLSIESGLLTPAIRVVLAAVFAGALLAAGEAARKVKATRDDPRIGQALSGAGVASAYATLYLAAAAYHLVGPLAGFAWMLAITAGGLALALRQGPPTAVMALAGGFAAPLVAGFDAAGVVPLLVYLALFVGALLALAVARGWTWLALASVAAAFGWSGFLLAMVAPGEVAAVGGFVVALAVAATLALPAAGAQGRWVRALPIGVGLAELLIAAPLLDYGVLAWGYYLVLSGAAIVLAWRERVLLPAAAAAAALVLVLIAAGLAQDARGATAGAAVAATLLFGGAGFARARAGPTWAGIAVAGIAGPALLAQGLADALLPAVGWAVIDLLLAGAAGMLSWRHRADGDAGLVAGALAAAALAAAGLQQLMPPALVAVPLALVAVGLALWRRQVRQAALDWTPAVPLVLLVILAVPVLGQVAMALAQSIAGEELILPLLPPAFAWGRFLVPPVAALVAVAALLPGGGGRQRRVLLGAAAGAAVLLGYLILKQPFAVTTAARFASVGFVERATITLALAGAGWGIARAGRWPAFARILMLVALARLVWFDLLLLSPVFAPQAVGSVPLLNAAVLLPALLAVAVWTFPQPHPHQRTAAALLVLVALAAAVRQATHGSVMTGGVSVAENWGYSAALLGAALVWLWRGIARDAADLRRLGLGALTAATCKVFLVDAAALEGVLRILSFMGLGVALIAIGWAYRRFLTAGDSAPRDDPAPA